MLKSLDVKQMKVARKVDYDPTQTANRCKYIDRTWRDTTDLLSGVPRKGFAETAKAAMFASC